MTYRMAKLTAWYHQAKPRCDTVTLAEQQCIFSASWTGKSTKGPVINLCKIHAQMADFPVKPLEAHRILVRDE